MPPARRCLRDVLLAGATAARAAVPSAGWPVPQASPAPTAPLTSAGIAMRADPSGSAAAAKGRCSKGAAGALAELGCELAAGLGGLEGPVAVAAAPPVSDAPVSRGADLSTRLAGFVAKELGARPLTGALSLSEARAQAGGVKVLVVVSTTLAQGRARATAAAFPAALGFWDRLRVSQAPLAEATAVRRLDGELASFLPKVALAPTPAERAAGVDALALACGDVSGDGQNLLVVEGRRKIALGRIENGHFSVRAEADWATLSPIAPSPLREPIGSVTIRPGRFVDVGLTDRASGVELSPALAVTGRLDAPLPWELVGCLSRAGVALGAPKPCRRDEPAGVKLGDAAEIDVFASGLSVDATGKSEQTVAFRNARTREVTVRDGAGRSAQLGTWGGALAVADVDLDGDPEILTSLPTDDPGSDALVVSTWAHDRTVRERARIPVKEGVRSVAVCPPEDLRTTPIAVGTGTGLWILR